MNILVTGCAGFVGWKTCHLLLAAGHRVVGLDDVNTYYPPGLKEWRLRELQARAPGRFTFQRGDVLDTELLETMFSAEAPEAVINLAARAGVRPSIENPDLYVRTNVLGVNALVAVMVRHGVRKLVQASTSSVYAGQPSPFVETQPVDQPLSPYAASKKASELMAYTAHHLHGLDVSVVRYFTVYGPAGRPDMSPLKFVHRIARGEPFPLYGDGEQSRDFTYIDDIASGTVAALKPLGYEIINLGGGNAPVTINTMIGIMESCLGKKAVIDRQPFNPADMKETSADITKARSLLGWEPQTPPEAGFKALVSWYLEEEKWLAPLLENYQG